jgi:hypothetical protein
MLSISPLVLTDTNLISTNIAEPDEALWNAATTYSIGQFASVVAPNVHKRFQSSANGNINNNPLLSPSVWTDAGSTNRWRMFDGVVNSQSTRADLIEAQVFIPEIIDSISLHNVDAQSIRIVQTDAVEGVIYDTEVTLVSDAGVVDYWEYFYLPVERINFYTFTGLFLYPNTTWTIQIKDSGGVAKCGACFFGLSNMYGETEFGLEVGRTDYSNVITDEFGNTSIVKRVNARNLQMNVWVKNDQLAFVDKQLSKNLSVPSVYIGTLVFQEATTLYGIYQDYSIVVSYLDFSILNIRFKGMI